MTVELTLPPLPMTADDFERLPEVDGVRFELEEENLLVMTATCAAWHGNMVVDLVLLFRQRGMVAIPERTVRLTGGTMRSCDIGVFHKNLEDLRQSVHQPAEFAICRRHPGVLDRRRAPDRRLRRCRPLASARARRGRAPVRGPAHRIRQGTRSWWMVEAPSTNMEGASSTG